MRCALKFINDEAAKLKKWRRMSAASYEANESIGDSGRYGRYRDTHLWLSNRV